eukprot:5654332-Amphidinium_carterae.1
MRLFRLHPAALWLDLFDYSGFLFGGLMPPMPPLPHKELKKSLIPILLARSAGQTKALPLQTFVEEPSVLQCRTGLELLTVLVQTLLDCKIMGPALPQHVCPA